MMTSSPRLRRRMPSLSMLKVFPTPGAYPRKTLNRPLFFSVSLLCSQSSGDFFVSTTPYNSPYELTPHSCGHQVVAGVCCSGGNCTRVSPLAPRQPNDSRANVTVVHLVAGGRVGPAIC